MKNKFKELTSLIAFWIGGLIIVLIVGYGIAFISSSSMTTADEITTARECRNAGYAWHAVDGCTTQENFVNQYVDTE